MRELVLLGRDRWETLSLFNPSKSSSKVFWFTGLSGAGKSSLCTRLVEHLRLQGRPIVMLDGDELREIMHATGAHARIERLALAMRYAHLCHLISVQGIDVAIATISMFREVHGWNRQNLPGYVEIFLDVPLTELARRDPKTLYERAARGEIRNVAGLDIEVDKPQNPDIHIEWRPGMSLEFAFGQILEELQSEKHI